MMDISDLKSGMIFTRTSKYTKERYKIHIKRKLLEDNSKIDVYLEDLKYLNKFKYSLESVIELYNAGQIKFNE